MNKNVKTILMTWAAATMVLLAGVGNPASAQYLVSARAGLVNYTTGPVSYSTSSDPAWRKLPTHLQLDQGDRIRTEAWGKAEILLNPGSYLRIANTAEVVILSTDLTAISFETLSGSAILEAGSVPDGATITVQTPITRVLIKKDGLYRIDVASDALTLTVRQGEAYFVRADGALEKVKKNKKVLITAKEYQIAKWETSPSDEFDLWSADRAEMLLAANQSFVQRTGSWSWPRLFWSAWVYDPFFDCYTFFPWGFFSSSVYGYGSYCPWYCNGYWAGGGYPTGGYRGGRGGSRGPTGGTPPTRAIKAPSTVTLDKVRPLGVVSGPRSDDGIYRPSSDFPKSGSIGSPQGSFGRGPSTGGAPSDRLGGASSPRASGAVKLGGGHGKD